MSDALSPTSVFCATGTRPALPAPGIIRVLALGDVVARQGRDIIAQQVPRLKRQLGLDLVLANGENSAGGIGITPSTAKELLAAGVDIITTGNHVWRHKECQDYIRHETRLLRPANYPAGTPGEEFVLHTLPGGVQLAVVNLLGRTFMQPVDCPFQKIDSLLPSIHAQTPLVIVDFHAEATSEKRAMALYLDGRCTLIYGTHTHVQTADAMITQHGTASISDIGMCGVEMDAVLGMHKQTSIQRFLYARGGSFLPAKGKGTLNGIIVDMAVTTGKAQAIYLLRHNRLDCINYHSL